MDRTKLESHQGRFIFITGLSGAGKTTLATLLTSKMRTEGRPVVMLDGDALRESIGEDLGHSMEERKVAAMRYSRLAKLLITQNIDVVLATISMFEDVRSWNRSHFKNYFEVYLRVSREELERRNQKGLYGLASKHVVGIDLKFDEPKSSDFVCDNEKSINPESLSQIILEKIQKKFCF